MIDYYKILGLAHDSSDHEIKQKYRELVLKHHPDINNDPDSEKRTKEITEAYSTLSDPEKRAAYDRRFFSQEYIHSNHNASKRESSQQYSSQTNNSNAGYNMHGDVLSKERSSSEGLLDQFLKIIGMLAILWILLRRPTIIIGIVLIILLFYVLWVLLKEIYLFFEGKK